MVARRRESADSRQCFAARAGAAAAEDRASLKRNNIHGKMCTAGTVGPRKYVIVDMSAIGVQEFPAFPSNKLSDPDWLSKAVKAVKGFAEFWQRRGRIIVHCKHGANSSAAMVALLMAVYARCTAREALDRSRPHQVASQVLVRTPCRCRWICTCERGRHHEFALFGSFGCQGEAICEVDK